jgi:hypothetical protein
MAEIAERCGVVAGEARVLLALQRAAQQRGAPVPTAARPAPPRAVAARTGRAGAL